MPSITISLRLAPLTSLLFVLTALLSPPVQAGYFEWTAMGPTGGFILQLVSDPQDPKTVYAVAFSGGLYRSTDGGESWRHLTEIQGNLSIDPWDSSVLYLNGDNINENKRLFRSTDGGVSWRDLSGDLPNFLPAGLAINPETPGILYLGGRFQSTDRGESWQPLAAQGLPGDLFDLKITTTSPPMLYGAFRTGFGPDQVFRSTDLGATWTEISQGLPMTPYGATTLTLHPRNPQILYASISNRGLYRSANGGESWELRFEGPVTSDVFWVRDLVIDPDTPSTLYAALRDAGIFVSEDDGQNWAAMNQGLSDIDATALNLAPGRGRPLLAGTVRHGVHGYSTRRGWRVTNQGLVAQRVRGLAFDATDPSVIYANVALVGVVHSADRGAHWTVKNSSGGFEPTALAVDPARPEILYADLGNGAGLIRSTDHGETWAAHPLRHGALALTFDPLTPDTIYIGTRQGVFKSIDGGASWSEASLGLRDLQVQALVIDPLTPSTLYAAIARDGIYKTTDGGGLWTQIFDYPGTAWIRTIAIDPQTPSTLYFGTPGDGIYRSTDGGDSWTQRGLPHSDVRALVIDPNTPSTLYAGTWGDSIHRSLDGGATWRPFDQGLGHSRINALAMDPTNSRLYAALEGGGVYDIQVTEEPDVLRFHGGRFTAEVKWRDFRDAEGVGTVIEVPANGVGGVPLRSINSSVIEFFDAGNWEMLVKVLDGQTINNHFWVFLAAATNVEYQVAVTDTRCGETRTYSNPLATRAPAVTDTEAFRGCPLPSPPNCAADEDTLCLGEDGRFRVEITWRDFQSGVGRGRQVELPSAGRAASDDSGLFYFFAGDNWELLVKVLDGCAVNNRFWVFSAATTNVEYTLTVTDTTTGAVRTYINELGAPAAALNDTSAFESCAF